nr:SRPBCC family protein [uncultured Dongia sp.]
MNKLAKSNLDLDMSRVIKAPRVVVWDAWRDPAKLAQWWIPAPLTCRIITLDLRPGGGFVTEMSEDGSTFTPHMNACFLSIEDGTKIVFTNALMGGWRPAAGYYPCALTAIITLRDHPQGTEYVAHVMHKNAADRDQHAEMGFLDGWGTVVAQLAKLVE